MKTFSHSASTTAFDAADDFGRRIAYRAAAVTRDVLARVGAWRADRRRRAKLMSLDPRILRDIGVAEDEIRELKARRNLLPVGWTLTD